MTTGVRRFTVAAFVLLLALAAGASAQSGMPSSMATLWQDGDPGERLELRGQVLDPTGRPLPGATVLVWQANGAGVYTEPYRGMMVTDDDGVYVLRTAMPGNYGGPMHIHMAVQHPTHGSVNARVLFKGDPGLSPDLEQEAVVLDETSIGGQRVWVGSFDVTIGVH